MSTVTVSDTLCRQRSSAGRDCAERFNLLAVAQSVINVVPAMKSSLDISFETLTLAVSLSALFSGCFVVASGGLADKFGRMRMTALGLGLSIIPAAPCWYWPRAGAVPRRPGAAGLSAACIMPATLALIKTVPGRARQRAVSFWVIGSWGGSGLCALSLAEPSPPAWAGAGSSSSPLPSLCWRCFLLRGTPESRSASASQHKLDVGGLLSLIVGLVLVNLFISKGHGWGWASPLSLSMLGGGADRWRGVYSQRAAQRRAALIDFALFRQPGLRCGGTIEFSAQQGDWHHDDRQHLATARAPPDAAGERNGDPRLSGHPSRR